jgi:hypothetical protein
MPVEALGLGVGHWRVREHSPIVGKHLVLAALEADRAFEARQHLRALDMHPDTKAVKPLRDELARAIAASEQEKSGA